MTETKDGSPFKRLARVALLALAACGGSNGSANTANAGPGPRTAVVPSPGLDTAGSTAAPFSVPAAPEPLADLRALPRGAAVYGIFRPNTLDALGKLGAEVRDALRALANMLGGSESVTNALRRFGVGADAPFAFAILPPALAPERDAIDALAAGKKPPAAPASTPDNAVRVRLRVQIAPGTDVGAAFPTGLGKENGPDVVLCKQAPTRCAAIGASGVALATSRRVAFALRVADDTLDIDVVAPLHVDGSDPRAVAVLGLALPEGGPEAGRCRIPASTGAGLCVDAERAGELGAANGWAAVARAVDGAGIDPQQRATILRYGRQEGARNLELASPTRRLLDDGSAWLVPGVETTTLHARWTIAPAARTAVEQSFATERCATRDDVVPQLFQPLYTALGDPGAEFADPKANMSRLAEGGNAAYVVALGRAWPNLLRDEAILRELGSLAGAHATCLRAADGVLELRRELGPIEGSRPRRRRED